MTESANQKAMQALANPIRRRIVALLRAGEMSVNSLVGRFDVARPAISRHLRVLREADLVTYRSDHNVRYYALNPSEMERLRRGFDAEFSDFWRPQGSEDPQAQHSNVTTVYQPSYEVEIATSLPISHREAYLYCTQKQKFREWVGPDAMNDARPGGLVKATSAFGASLEAEYLALEDGKLLVLRLIEPLDKDENLYTIRFEPEGSGCRIALRHYVREEAVAKLVAMAWGETLKVLHRHVTGRGDRTAELTAD